MAFNRADYWGGKAGTAAEDAEFQQHLAAGADPYAAAHWSEKLAADAANGSSTPPQPPPPPSIQAPPPVAPPPAEVQAPVVPPSTPEAPVAGLVAAGGPSTPSMGFTPLSGASAAPGASGGAGGASGSSGASAGLLPSMGAQAPSPTDTGGGFRPNMGQRAYPKESRALAGLKRAY